MNKTKKWIKLKKHADSGPRKISVQLEDEYYQNGKTTQIQKIYNNFHFLEQILAKIIINFSDFSVFFKFI